MLEARGLSASFGAVRAVAGIDLTISDDRGGVGLVGESGSGKTTVGRMMLKLLEPTAGTLALDGSDVSGRDRRALRAFRREVQVVFQDTETTLNPRMRIGSAIGEVLRVHRIVPAAEIAHRVVTLLGEVGLDAEVAGRMPHQLSGGQRQRVAIARALAVEPRFMIFDEPTSALDVTVQERVLALIETIRDRRRFGYLLISHNLAVVERLCAEVHVLYLGGVVERGPTRRLLGRPAHPYTVALRSAVPSLEPDAGRTRIVLTGPAPDPANPAPGCTFHPRCPIAVDRCRVEVPLLREVSAGQWSACHRAEEVLAQPDLVMG
jgi:oligopeptide transport system ATP-binding protein